MALFSGECVTIFSSVAFYALKCNKLVKGWFKFFIQIHVGIQEVHFKIMLKRIVLYTPSIVVDPNQRLR